MAWKLLLESDIGLASLATIGFVLVMGAYFVWYAGKKGKEDAKQGK